MHAAQQYATPTVGGPMPNAKISSALSTYRNEQLMNLSAVDVIHKLYAVAIQAIKKNDVPLAHRAINELIAALNFEYQEVALTLFRLYQYTKHCLRKGRTNEALEVLEELRSAWGEAFKL
jgi:flagellin-specific chaperone FliS